MPNTDMTALIVGASRGLGLGLVREYLDRGWNVVATQRGESGLAGLSSKRLVVETVDIMEAGAVVALHDRLAGRLFDLLFVNAGVSGDRVAPIGDVPADDFASVMLTNAYAPMRLIDRFDDLVAPRGTIAVMSSGLASIADNDRGGWETYRASKAALNMMMRSYAARASGGRSLLTCAPGWVRTDMGGDAAPLDVETSIRGLVDVIEARRGRAGNAYVNYRGETMRW